MSNESLLSCCFQDDLFVFWQFYYNVSRCGSFYIYPTWICLVSQMHRFMFSFFLMKFGKLSNLIQVYFLPHFYSLLWVTHCSYVSLCPRGFWGSVYFSFYSFFLLLKFKNLNWPILNSLILSPACSILLSSPSSEFFISVIVLHNSILSIPLIL